MERELICIVCPKGCKLKVRPETETITAENVSGNLCKRGLVYAVNECTNPVRTLTTTVKIEGSRQKLVPVKSSLPLPKNKLFDYMAVINTINIKAPVKIGDVIVKDILGTGIDIISAANVSGEENVWMDGISSHLTRAQQARVH